MCVRCRCVGDGSVCYGYDVLKCDCARDRDGDVVNRNRLLPKTHAVMESDGLFHSSEGECTMAVTHMYSRYCTSSIYDTCMDLTGPRVAQPFKKTNVS